MSHMAARYAGITWIAIRERLRYRFDFFMTLMSTLMFSVMYYFIWKAIYLYSDTAVLPWPQMATYIMVGQAINFSRWSPADRGAVYAMASRIRSGDVALDLIRPIGYQVRRFLESLGFFIVEVVWVTMPCLALFMTVLDITPPVDATAAAGFFVSILIAFLVAFSLNSIVMVISFWSTNAQGIQIAKKAVIDLLAGTLVPFDFFPLWFKSIVIHLPFQGMAYIPLSIYTGRLAGSAMHWALLQQLGWAIFMLVISRLLWYWTSKRITINGG